MSVKTIKSYFGKKGVNKDMDYPEINSKELLELKRKDPAGYDELSELADEAEGK